jgi:beta-lactam-binding protein with PASTA domain
MTQVDSGSTIAGRYRLEERLDAGGRAQVWRAADLELGRPVAVKILLTPEGADPSFLGAFRDEAQLEARMTHPGIVEVFDWGHDGDANYVVMEFLEGHTVRKLLRSGPLKSDLVLTLGRQAAAALAYAHGEGVAHGSIGPDHVMIAPNGDTTLIDFGLQCRGACEYPALPDSDTAALGSLLYEALTGASPTGPRPAGLPEHEAWPEHPHKLSPDVSPGLDHVVMKAISPDPAENYRTAAELQAALDELARPKSRAWLWTLIAVVAVLLAALGTWYFASQMKVVVPDVTGVSPAQAQSTLSSAGLKMVVTGQVASADLPAGAVVSESPAAGIRVRRGSQVGVAVSTGKPTARVPTVTGISLESASSALASAGLVLGTVTKQNSTTFPTNTVITQSPAADQQLTAGSKVDLVVSAGQAQVTLPDVRGMTQANATARLTNLGLVASVGNAYSGQPRGVVVTQGPVAGTTVPAGSTVTISVSRGPAPVKVPDVLGALAADAKSSIQDLGLVPVSTTTSGTASEVGRVIDQTPDPGTSVAAGSQVQITIGK